MHLHLVVRLHNKTKGGGVQGQLERRRSGGEGGTEGEPGDEGGVLKNGRHKERMKIVIDLSYRPVFFFL